MLQFLSWGSRISLNSTISGVQAGAIFVDQSATEYFNTLFSSAGLDAEDIKEYTDEAVKSFETEAKKAFNGESGDDVSIKVAGHKVTERSVNIRRGILTLPRFASHHSV